jgi:hypothetical protein
MATTGTISGKRIPRRSEWTFLKSMDAFTGDAKGERRRGFPLCGTSVDCWTADFAQLNVSGVVSLMPCMEVSVVHRPSNSRMKLAIALVSHLACASPAPSHPAADAHR